MLTRSPIAESIGRAHPRSRRASRLAALPITNPAKTTFEQAVAERTARTSAAVRTFFTIPFMAGSLVLGKDVFRRNAPRQVP